MSPTKAPRVSLILTLAVGVLIGHPLPVAAQGRWTSLFNGKDLTGWKIPAGDNGHWKVVDGVIDYDAESEAPGDKNLWSEKEYGDFTLQVEWRIKAAPYLNTRAPVVLPDGTHARGPDGKELRAPLPDADSGIYLRGSSKAQVNIWCWPIGSGEVYGYRTDSTMPRAVRRAVTPRRKADRPLGEWNRFVITMKGQRLTVVLNGVKVIDRARLPGVAARGKLALQHHGDKQGGKWNTAPALVQFRALKIAEL